MIENYIKLLQQYRKVPKQKVQHTFFEISGFPHYENVCSNILSYYLKPSNEHSLEDLVLKSLLTSADKDYRFDIYDEVEVEREVITSIGNRLDLLVQTSSYIIGIENKIFHYLNNDLKDYRRLLESRNTLNNSKEIIGIVLTLQKIIKPSEIRLLSENGFINVTYDDLFRELKQNYSSYALKANIKYLTLLNEFILSIESLTGKSMNDNKLWKFFSENAAILEDFSKDYNSYINYLNEKISFLKQNIAIDSNEVRIWIWKKFCLVTDFTIQAYKFAIDTYIKPQGWEIQIFGRDDESHQYVKSPPFRKIVDLNSDSYQKFNNERIIYLTFKVDESVETVKKALEDLIHQILHGTHLPKQTSDEQAINDSTNPK
ncbi:PD-(D/E)XK nuclease family protein [Adhaeribacter arboris]|nr:PD-(D/E)XK nuclease family protein [Adhaeribacter arboris]